MGRALTDRQRVFVEAIIEGKNPTQAARRAGYSPEYATQTGYHLLRSPLVSAEIRHRHRATIENDLVPAALATLGSIIRDKDQPSGVRVKASQVALQAGGYLGALKKDEAANTNNKPLSEMTVDELAQAAKEQRERLNGALTAVEELQKELAAPVIDIVPDEATDDTDGDPWE